MNSEEQFARQVCRVLDRGTGSIGFAITERLRAARERACALQPNAIVATQIVGAGGTAQLNHGDESHPWLMLLAVLALIIGMSISYYWNSYDQASELEEIDSELLAGDLPPKAYLDPGFQAWISHYAQQSEQSAQ
jgi:hypothetical protein